MKLAAMLSDTLRSLVRSPVTERTPRPAPKRLRGKLHWSAEGCTGCALCVKDCPANALELIRLDEKSKHFVIRYHVDRCTFCGQCVENCRFDCLRMTDGEWSLAAPTREGFTIYYGDDADVRRFVADHSTNDDPTPRILREDRGDGDRS